MWTPVWSIFQYHRHIHEVTNLSIKTNFYELDFTDTTGEIIDKNAVGMSSDISLLV